MTHPGLKDMTSLSLAANPNLPFSRSKWFINASETSSPPEDHVKEIKIEIQSQNILIRNRIMTTKNGKGPLYLGYQCKKGTRKLMCRALKYSKSLEYRILYPKQNRQRACPIEPFLALS